MILPIDLLGEILTHCLAEHPVEACGILAGPPGGVPVRCVRMVNAERSYDAYAFDPAEQLAVWAELDERGEDPLVFWHSHTRGRAYPSEADVRYAADTEAYYLIIATQDPNRPVIRAFRIVDGTVIEEPVTAA